MSVSGCAEGGDDDLADLAGNGAGHGAGLQNSTVAALLDADAFESNPTAVAVSTSSSISPATGGAAAFPEVTASPGADAQKRPGRPRKDPNHGKDTSKMAALHALRNGGLDRRADKAGLPVIDRLFSGHTLASCTSDLERVQVISGLVLAAFPQGEAAVPLTEADAYLSGGTIKDRAAVALFGRWLILKGAPGSKQRRGKPADRFGVLKLVATLACDQIRQGRLEDEQDSVSPSSVKRLSDIHVAADFHALIGEEITPGAVRSLRKSSALFLSEFLAHAGAALLGRTISPLLSAVLAMLDGGGTSRSLTAVAPAFTGPMVSSAVRPGVGFTVASRYSDAAQAEQYRPGPAASLDGPKVIYSAARKVARMTGGTHYAPEISPLDVRSEAVIDRMILRVETCSWASHTFLKAAIDRTVCGSVYVKDLTDVADSLADRDEVGLPLTSRPGTYDITVQRPTPAGISEALGALKSTLGLAGEPEITLLELSVDFYAPRGMKPADAQRRREQMVTVLHRHHYHWADPTLQPKDTERRQVFLSGEVTLKRPLFEHSKRSVLLTTLRDMSQPEARAMILGALPEQILLNSAVYDGERHLGLEVALQHKVTDKRDPSKGTYHTLPAEERRARMEVILSGHVLHETFNIRRLEDLTRDRLRSIKREHLSLFLPVLSDNPVVFAAEAERFARGGVYALDLYQRAIAVATDGRKGKGKHGQLKAWTEMNDRVGEAIDRLAVTWKGALSI